jgi:hypothetical protein
VRYEARVCGRTGIWPFRRNRWRVWDAQVDDWVTYAPGTGHLSALLVALGLNNAEAREGVRDERRP